MLCLKTLYVKWKMTYSEYKAFKKCPSWLIFVITWAPIWFYSHSTDEIALIL